MRLHGTAMPAGQHLARSAAGLAGPGETPPSGAGHGGGGHLAEEFPASPARRPATSDGHLPDGRPARQFPADPGGAPIIGDGFSTGTRRAQPDRPARWLTTAMLSLGVLAAAAAVVSYSAQYQMVLAAKADTPVAALEAGIPDVAALIFATLGIALALHGKRAIRARALNIGAVATSITMNVLAAGHGWRDLAIWAMPPVAYALASDTAIGVVRAWAIARQKAMNEALADDNASPLAILGGLLLWALRLVLAPASTLTGFRDWVLNECPVAPGPRRHPGQAARAQIPPAHKDAISSRPAPRRSGHEPRQDTKTARFLALVAERHGPLAAFPLASVSRACTELAPEVGLHPGAARTALRRHVQSLQNGSHQ